MIAELLKDKGLKPKEKTETISRWLLDGSLTPQQLMNFAASTKDSGKATCIEALEFAVQTNRSLVDDQLFRFITTSLTDTAPRVKWESAKVIARTAADHQSGLEQSIAHLLMNADHEGTVVRWSAATALSAILLLKTGHNEILVPAVEALLDREGKDSIRKIYSAALKKLC